MLFNIVISLQVVDSVVFASFNSIFLSALPVALLFVLINQKLHQYTANIAMQQYVVSTIIKVYKVCDFVTKFLQKLRIIIKMKILNHLK